MKICNYGITLNRLRQEDLDFIHRKLYSERAVQPTDTSVEITNEMHQKWFDSINNDDHLYFMIEYKGMRTGMLNTRITDWQAGTSESELILWESPDYHAEVLVPALLCLLEFEFYYLNWNISYLQVDRDSKLAISSAVSLGYQIEKNRGNAGNQLYFLTREAFETAYKNVLPAVKPFKDKVSGDGYLLLEPVDYESGIARKTEDHIINSGIYLRRKGKAGSRMYFRK